ncbi:EGF-like domain-containing protein [Pseudoscourfieldia marina]
MGDNMGYIDLGTGRTVKQVAAGGTITCAILDNDKVKCWGRNHFGALGYGDTNDRGGGASVMGDNLPYVDVGTGRTVLAVARGYGPMAENRACVLLDNNKVKCWGWNADGGLGYEDSGDTANRGDMPNDMGDNLPYVDLGSA